MSKPKIKLIDLKDLVYNTGQIPGVPKNPRFIRDESFEMCKRSVREDPDMLSLREITAYPLKGDDGKTEYVVVMGNQRLRAIKENAKEDKEFAKRAEKIVTKVIPEDTPAKKICAMIIKDNGQFGKWDYDALANEWDDEELEKSGLDLSEWKVSDQDFEDKNQEIDVDAFDEEMQLKIKLTPEAMRWVKERLALVNDRMETALLTIFGWYE